MTRNAFSYKTLGPLLAAGAVSAFMASPVLASFQPGQVDNITGETTGFLCQIKNWLFTIVYVLGAIGLVIIAVTAFLGKFKWAHLISLGGGLFVVATADLILRFMAGAGVYTC